MKIIGNGLIAKSFYDSNKFINYDCLIFASGVSNSTESNSNNFLKEIELINKTIDDNKELKIIYFSSIFINRDNPYYKHKLEIENIIQKKCKDFLILRLPQLVGNGGNPKNIFNFFKDKLIKGETISIIKNSERSLIDIEDVRDFIFFGLENNFSGIINFSSIEKIDVLQLAILISKNLNINLNFELLINSENSITFDNSPEIEFFLTKKGIRRNGYIHNLIKKYLTNDKNY